MTPSGRSTTGMGANSISARQRARHSGQSAPPRLLAALNRQPATFFIFGSSAASPRTAWWTLPVPRSPKTSTPPIVGRSRPGPGRVSSRPAPRWPKTDGACASVAASLLLLAVGPELLEIGDHVVDLLLVPRGPRTPSSCPGSSSWDPAGIPFSLSSVQTMPGSCSRRCSCSPSTLPAFLPTNPFCSGPTRSSRLRRSGDRSCTRGKPFSPATGIASRHGAPQPDATSRVNCKYKSQKHAILHSHSRFPPIVQGVITTPIVRRLHIPRPWRGPAPHRPRSRPPQRAGPARAGR